MTEQHPPSETHEQSLQKKIEWLVQSKSVEITDGFPVRDKDELWQVIWHFFNEDHLTRFPIIGIFDPEDPESGTIKTFMMFEPGGKAQHITLWEMIEQGYQGKELRCAYTTGLDGFSTSPTSPSLVLEKVQVPDHEQESTFYLQLMGGSVFVRAKQVFRGALHPLDKEFTREGKKEIARIFGMLDISFNS